MAQRQTLQTVLACGKLRFHELQVRLYIFVNLLLVFITKFLTNVLGPSYELLTNFSRTPYELDVQLVEIMFQEMLEIHIGQLKVN